MSVKEFFENWEHATSELSYSEKGRLMCALVAELKGESVALSGNEKFVFPLFASFIKDEKEERTA